MAATAIPAVVAFTDEVVFCALVLKSPLFPEFEVEVAWLPVPVPVASDAARVDPGVRGMAGLI